jgi:threonine dehydrogenase-like Zn-dependent dehydrogenase
MMAAVYDGPRTVTVKDMPDARIERPTDVLLRITDMVVVPFNISCGFCANCERGLTAFCLTTNPDPRIAGAAYGFADMGPYHGGQAEFLRVPYGDFNCLVLPPDAWETDRQKDYVMLADIFPTGWHATRLAEMIPGDTVVIYGAGPVGLMAAYSATLQSASKVWVVDRHPDRLNLAERIGAIPIDYSKTSPIDRIMEDTGGLGADRGCECVGYQATDAQGQEHPNITLNNLVQSVRFTGGIGVVGVFVAQDPSSPDPLYKEGEVAFDYGMFWFKGQQMGTGQCKRQGVQPQAVRADRRGQGAAVLRRVTRASAGRRTRGVPAFRPPRHGLDEGRHAPRRPHVTAPAGRPRASRGSHVEPRPQSVLAALVRCTSRRTRQFA